MKTTRPCILGSLMVLAILAACSSNKAVYRRDPSVPAPAIYLFPVCIAPTSFVLRAYQDTTSSGIEVKDIFQSVTGPLRAPQSQLVDFNTQLREKARPAQVIEEMLPLALERELPKALKDDCRITGNPLQANAVLSVHVAEFGFYQDTYQPLLGTVKPRVVFQAQMQLNPPTAYNDVLSGATAARYVSNGPLHRTIWRSNIVVVTTYRGNLFPGWAQETYARKPEILRRSLMAACNEGALQVSRRLRTHLIEKGAITNLLIPFTPPPSAAP